MENQAEMKTNADAVIALILGIVSLIIPVIGFITAIIGIIYSIKSLKIIKRTNEPGKGLSITGLVCSILSILFHIIAAVSIIIAFVLFAAEPASGNLYY